MGLHSLYGMSLKCSGVCGEEKLSDVMRKGNVRGVIGPERHCILTAKLSPFLHSTFCIQLNICLYIFAALIFSMG
jgi:hypothetical protein